MSETPLRTLEDCHKFMETQTPLAIVNRIIVDQQLCRNDHKPSLLVHCLPRNLDELVQALSVRERIPLSVARFRLKSIIDLIKARLASISRKPDAFSTQDIPPHLIPTDDDLRATLKVLRYLQLPLVSLLRGPTTSLDQVVAEVESQLNIDDSIRDSVNRVRKPRAKKNCYICNFIYHTPHTHYPSLCSPCGDFNIASSSLSLPGNLSLPGKTALVTGARINLGYHSALRLLRCGARVIVSSRYPMDAQKRYLAEPDAMHWQDRLRVVGADFRSAKDVFSLVKVVITCLQTWTPPGQKPKLDILINNAAQTLTDTVEKEEEAVRRETELYEEYQDPLLVESSYVPRVRGGVAAVTPHLIERGPGFQNKPHSTEHRSARSTDSGNADEDPQDHSTTLITSKDARSSWVQTVSEVPYEDVISAHSVNTFVPFILLRELLPYLSQPPSTTLTPESESQSTPTSKSPSQIPTTDSNVEAPGTAPQTNQTKPTPGHPKPITGYVINVSSREGLYESTPDHRAKNGHHVHTNMSKAALNMLTDTEAFPAWKKYRVAINTVDPGYMSADPEFMKMVGREGAECPLGWGDGAGRVLWPIVKGEKGEPVWGRFLKHFTIVDAVRS